jgi:N-acetylmuramoyl-L-alanine amidase
MRPAAPCALIGLALALSAIASLVAGEAVLPTRPSRPGSAPPANHGVPRKDVSLVEIAAQLGLKAHWREGLKDVTLSDGARSLQLEADSRDSQINGVRVFLGNPVRVRARMMYVSRIDYETCLVPLLRPGFGVVARPCPRVIALDAGHGGIDQGAQNSSVNLQEKKVTLDVVLRLKKLLEARGYKVVLTRTGDRELSPDKQKDLAMRSDVANSSGADLFISVHFNSNPDPKISGVEVYTFTPQNQRSSNSWSTNEADAEDEGAPVNHYDHWSAVLAQAIHREVLNALKTADRGKKLMHSGVLRRVKCPAILVESAFLSNEADARRVAKPEYREQIAEALAAGVDDYTAVLASLGHRAAHR